MISVIIPVYNKAPWIKRCLESVANQTNKTAQVILVNDGSTDGSGDICDEYAKKNGWEVYHTKNKGVSAARNLGIRKSKGDYIAFLDADDAYEPKAIETMLNMTKDEKYNVIQFGQYRIGIWGKSPHPMSPRGDYDLPKGVDYWEFTTNKLYKRSFIKENKIKFIGFKGNYDVVYVIKDSSMNPELVYSLRSLEKNWQYKNVWFCGGCPERIKPDHHMKIEQTGINKWEKVRNMVIKICKNDQITDNFWLFNDDFFVLKKIPENMPAQYNGRLIDYVERIEKRRGGPDGFTVRLRQAAEDLKEAGLDTLNYEVHKPMLFNRKKLLEALEKFPNTPAYRSIYGNYWKIGGQTKHDMKIKILKFSRMYNVESLWEFVSTSDVSFRDGNVGEFIRNKFKDKSRFEI